METIKVTNLTFSYPSQSHKAIDNISFSVNKGDFVTICGPSGCGKTTLLCNLKPCLAPTGEKCGKITFNGKDTSSLSLREQSEQIGFVMQSPENQTVTDKVWHELAFGLENLGYEQQTIRRRVAETACFFGIQNWFYKNVSELSGGQKQILNLASIMAMQPSLLILDEPTSQLDPIAANDFLECVARINRETGTTVIITEHRLDKVFSFSNKVLVMDSGKILSFDTPANTGKNIRALNSNVFMSMPVPMRIWQAVDSENSLCPVTVTQGRQWLEQYAESHTLYKLYEEQIHIQNQETAFEAENLWFRYEKDTPDILKGVSLKAYKGEIVAVLGGNGAGKTTLLNAICGIIKPYLGKINCCVNCNFSRKIAMMPQNPQTLFVKKTVKSDLLEVFDGKAVEESEKLNRFNYASNLCRLENLYNRHPYDLSGGEQQRVALAKILLLNPEILLLDEPTKGLDAEYKKTFASILKELSSRGKTIIMVSHDVEFCAEYASRCVMMFDGSVVSEGTPRSFFAQNSFYVTVANRMSRNVINNAVTASDVIFCCTGKKTENNFKPPKKILDFTDKKEPNNNPKITEKKAKMSLPKKVFAVISTLLLAFGFAANLGYFDFFNSSSIPIWINYLLIALPVIILLFCFCKSSDVKAKPQYNPSDKRKISKRTRASAIIILFAVPITIFFGIVYLHDKKYLFISLLVMLECMLPFFLVFEGRKPKERELVIIAVLCALAVGGRLAFFMLPQFKPVLALVFISAVAFGGESGFLVGAVSMLVSNIYFQQGPWTPWQMFAMGIVGFCAGVLFKKGMLSRTRISMCTFGFIFAVVIYGGIMNFSSAVTANATLNLKTIMSFYVTGFPMDVVHGIATAVFLYFGAEPMLEKLDRIKTKYGLIE